MPAHPRLQQPLAVGLAGAEDDAVADKDAGEAGQDHQGQRSAAGHQVSAGDQRHVFRQGDAQATGDEDGEDADVDRRPVEILQEIEEEAGQWALPIETKVLNLSRNGSISDLPTASC